MCYLAWYNHRRRHDALQMQSPISCEQEHQVAQPNPVNEKVLAPPSHVYWS